MEIDYPDIEAIGQIGPNIVAVLVEVPFYSCPFNILRDQRVLFPAPLKQGITIGGEEALMLKMAFGLLGK